MKNEEIYKNLPEPEFRKALGKLCYESLNNGGHADSIAFYQAEIERLKKKLEACEVQRGLNAVLKIKGWTWHDVSDELPFPHPEYHGFLGTPEEYDQTFHSK